MKAIIIDDEPLARERLAALLSDMGGCEIIAEGGNGIEALDLVQRCHPDILFLDIRMPGMDGLEVAKHLRQLPESPAVIFTTAYDEHALAAFDANAIDYLLKPIRAERLQAALVKANNLSAARGQALEHLETQKRRHVSGMAHGNLVLVNLEEVLYFQSDQGYTNVVWPGGELLIEDSLKALEDEFEQEFVRIHRSTLVAVGKVAEIVRDTAGNQVVKLRGVEAGLPVSRRMVGGLRRRIRNLAKKG